MTTPMRTIQYDSWGHIIATTGMIRPRGGSEHDPEAGVYLHRDDVADYLRSIDHRGNSNAELVAAADHLQRIP